MIPFSLFKQNYKSKNDWFITSIMIIECLNSWSRGVIRACFISLTKKQQLVVSIFLQYCTTLELLIHMHIREAVRQTQQWSPEWMNASGTCVVTERGSTRAPATAWSPLSPDLLNAASVFILKRLVLFLLLSPLDQQKQVGRASDWENITHKSI